MPRRTIVALVATFAAVMPTAALSVPMTGAGDCPLFPHDSFWHADVSALPVHERSDDLVEAIGVDEYVHADFGPGTWEGGPIGIPYTTVGDDQGHVEVRFTYADESDRGPYPIPADAPVEGGRDSDGDRHVLVVDRDACVLYELFAALPRADGSWEAGSGAVFDLRSNDLRPDGWTSADAAGLAMLPGLVRYEEVAAGAIDHPIRITAPRTGSHHVWPARHDAGHDEPGLPPMGTWMRLRADTDVSDLGPQARVVAEAMQRHGVILADNGSPWFVSGVPDERWNNDDLHTLHTLQGKDFEVVDASALMAEQDSGRVHPAGPTARSTAAACPEGEVPEGSFRDTPGSVHERAVDCVVWWRIARGETAGTYAPAAAVTRGAMATFIANLVVRTGGHLPSDPPDRFSDDDGSVHEAAIDALAAAGLVRGTGERRFEPGLAVGRAQTARFIAAADELRTGETLPPGSDAFADDDGSVHEAAIDRVAAAGIAAGTGARRFEPDASVTRGAAASFLARLLALVVEQGDASPPGS